MNNSETGILYIATNIYTNKKYIGITTKSIKERISGHLKSVKRGSKAKFHVEIRKFGIESFVFETFVFSVNDLIDKEIEYIKKYDSYNNGYNSTFGGVLNTGYKHTEENKYKSAWNRNKNLSEEHKNNISKSHLDLHFQHSDESKLQMSNSRTGKYKGRKQSKTHIQNKSNSLKNADYISFRKIKMTKPTGEIIEYCGSIKQFCEINDLIRRDVCYVLSGKRKSHKNWLFEYIN
jgi:group I intron endonuclease